MYAVRNWRSFASLTLFVCAMALAGCGKKPEPTKAEGEPKPPPGQQPPTPNPAAPNIDGTYLLVESQMFGKKQTAEEIAKDPENERTYVIKDNTISDVFGRKGKTQAIKLDASKTPHEIDVTDSEGGKPVPIYGIYKLEGDKLTLVLGAKKPEERPKDFSFGKDNLILVMVKKKK